MKRISVESWMALAESVDALRIFPRAMLIGYCIWAWYMCDRLLQFYFDLPSVDKQSTATATFCAAVIGVVTFVGTQIFNAYNSSARDWVAYRNGIAKGSP